MLRKLTLVKDDFEQTLLAGLKLVVLECPYDTVSSDETVDLIGKIIRFKVESYRKEYPYGILPFDGVDMVGTHYLLCETINGQLSPVMGVKTVTQKKLQEFHLRHPVLGLLGDGAEYVDHVKTMESLIQVANRENKNLGYFGSWTIRPDVRENRDLVQLCQRLLAGMAVHISHYYDFSSIITIAVSKYKVEGFHKFLGFRPLTFERGALPPFISAAMMGEQCSCSYMLREWWSDDTKALAERYKEVWDNRLEISARSIGEGLLKVA